MKKCWVVCDSNGASWNAKTEKPETFRTLAAAKKRAAEMADDSPGEEIGIFVLADTAIAHVAPVKFTGRQ